MTILGEELPAGGAQKGFLPSRDEYTRLLQAEAERGRLQARLEAARQALLVHLCRCAGRQAPHADGCAFPAAWAFVMSANMPAPAGPLAED